jgi:hypothetical protein
MQLTKRIGRLVFGLFAIAFMGNLNLEAAPDLEASMKNLEIALESPVLAEEALLMTIRLRTVFPHLDMTNLELKLTDLEHRHPKLQMRYKAGITRRYLQRNNPERFSINLAKHKSNESALPVYE